MARFLRDANPFSVKFCVLCSFIPAESLAGDIQRHRALCQGNKMTGSQPRIVGESSSSHCITRLSSTLSFLALDLGPGPMSIKLVRAQTRLTIKLISHCWLVREPQTCSFCPFAVTEKQSRRPPSYFQPASHHSGRLLTSIIHFPDTCSTSVTRMAICLCWKGLSRSNHGKQLNYWLHWLQCS